MGLQVRPSFSSLCTLNSALFSLHHLAVSWDRDYKELESTLKEATLQRTAKQFHSKAQPSPVPACPAVAFGRSRIFRSAVENL